MGKEMPSYLIFLDILSLPVPGRSGVGALDIKIISQVLCHCITYTIMNILRLSIYTSMQPSLLKPLSACTPKIFLDTLSDILE
jgi:hypothetical protein